MLVPAGSTWGGPGGDEWAEALQETAPLGSQQAMRAATHSEHRASPETDAAEADPPQPLFQRSLFLLAVSRSQLIVGVLPTVFCLVICVSFRCYSFAPQRAVDSGTAIRL
jgi:hypothetical protein